MPDNGDMIPPGGGNGGGMTPDPIPTPAFAALSEFDTTSTTSGGVGRILYMANTEGNAVDTNNMEVTDQNNLTPAPIQVDSKDAVLLIIADANINALLQSPLTAKLLDNTGVDITYANQPTFQTTTTPVTIAGGQLWSQAADSNGNTGNTSIYINSRAPVVLGYEVVGTNLEFTMIGEPLPTTVTDFSGTYSGFAAATRISSNAPIAASAPFTMTVGHSGGISTITNFNANLSFGGSGIVSASNIPINANATFTSNEGGTVTFTQGTDTISPVINSTGSGTLLGQFHGTNANGVTGAFYNSTDPAMTAPSILGGFAGYKE